MENRNLGLENEALNIDLSEKVLMLQNFDNNQN